MKTTHQSIIDRQAKEKQAFLEAFRKTPIVQAVCQQLHIGRSTYYRWKKEDPVFVSELVRAEIEGREYMNDVMESLLIQNAKDRDIASIIFYLKHNHPRYSESIYGVTPEDIVVICDYLEHSQHEAQEDNMFVSKLFAKRIPFKVGRYVLQIMRQHMYQQKIQQDEKKIDVLLQVQKSRKKL